MAKTKRLMRRAQGARVRITEGEFKGRAGTVDAKAPGSVLAYIVIIDGLPKAERYREVQAAHLEAEYEERATEDY